MSTDRDRIYLVSASRGVLSVGGPDRVSFLQGLITNDATRAAPDRAVYSGFLTAQGRYLHDFFLIATDDRLLLDVEAARRDDLRRRLSLYRLRSKVTLADETAQWDVVLLFGAEALAAAGLPDIPGGARPLGGGAVYVDPRLPALGARAMLPSGTSAALLVPLGFSEGGVDDYERLRLSLGVPDSSRDLPVEKALLLENGFDELHGLDWKKGCYVGQELTARMKYRALVRKRLTPVRISGPLPPAGTPVMLDAEEAGEMRSAAEGMGLALLRIDVVEQVKRSGQALSAGGASVTPLEPAWAQS